MIKVTQSMRIYIVDGEFDYKIDGSNRLTISRSLINDGQLCLELVGLEIYVNAEDLAAAVQNAMNRGDDD